MRNDECIILAIETALDGGSLSIIKDGAEIAFWTGMKPVSKAEEILEQIAELLKNSGIQKKHLNLIAVSKGPGSSTGAKIGQSIAKGLGNALGISVFEVSAAEALLEDSESSKMGRTITVLPSGKNLICFQFFENGKAVEDSDLHYQCVLPAEDFSNHLTKTIFDQILFQKAAFERYKAGESVDSKAVKRLHVTENNLSYLIGKRVVQEMRVR
jgi:tRNA threonylcarbamoyl adenosine modification protein YeaZ